MKKTVVSLGEIMMRLNPKWKSVRPEERRT